MMQALLRIQLASTPTTYAYNVLVRLLRASTSYEALKSGELHTFSSMDSSPSSNTR